MTDESGDRGKIEAVLYTTGKFMTLDEIAEACGVGSVGMLRRELECLKKEYAEKGSALEIQEHEGKYKLNIKKEYGFLANKLVGDGEMDAPTTKTLAVIAFKSPVMQSEIISIRGNKAYDHIRQLKEDGLVTGERSGRTRILKLTTKFYEYFDVSEKEIKEGFEGMEEGIKKNIAWKMGTTPEHVEMLEKQMAEKKEKENVESENVEDVSEDGCEAVDGEEDDKEHDDMERKEEREEK